MAPSHNNNNRTSTDLSLALLTENLIHFLNRRDIDADARKGVVPAVKPTFAEKWIAPIFTRSTYTPRVLLIGSSSIAAIVVTRLMYDVTSSFLGLTPGFRLPIATLMVRKHINSLFIDYSCLYVLWISWWYLSDWDCSLFHLHRRTIIPLASRSRFCSNHGPRQCTSISVSSIPIHSM